MKDGVYIRGLEGMRSLCWFSEDRSVLGLITSLSVGNSGLHLSFRNLQLSIGIGKYYLIFVGWLGGWFLLLFVVDSVYILVIVIVGFEFLVSSLLSSCHLILK